MSGTKGGEREVGGNGHPARENLLRARSELDHDLTLGPEECRSLARDGVRSFSRCVGANRSSPRQN